MTLVYCIVIREKVSAGFDDKRAVTLSNNIPLVKQICNPEPDPNKRCGIVSI